MSAAVASLPPAAASIESFDLPGGKLLTADALEGLRSLPSGSVSCVITSPPYWGLRDYGVEGQLGLEPKPEQFVANLVAIFREARRVLRDDGTLWLNLGDTAAAKSRRTGRSDGGRPRSYDQPRGTYDSGDAGGVRRFKADLGKLQPKDIVGIPWRVAFALQADGWILRQDLIWSKPNPITENVRDRCTKSHEYLFLLSKSKRYAFDVAAIAEPSVQDPTRTRRRRSVWNVSPSTYRGAHYATFPPQLIEPCVLAGCPRDGVVLDPFMGSGTTAVVANEHGRRWIGIDLDPRNVPLIRERLEAPRRSPRSAKVSLCR